MAQRKQLTWTELRVGLFVLVGLSVLAAGIFYVTGMGFLGPKYRLKTYLPEVSGLANGAPVRVDGVMGAFFLIRRSVIPPPSLFDEDFFFFYEDTALAHMLANRDVPCFVVPDATIVHFGGQSRSESSISSFYDGKYLYLKKFYGSFHARAVYFLDRARIFRKWLLYSLFSLVTSSERIKFKQRYYKLAWDAVRLR